MISAQRTQTCALDSEIVDAVTEPKPKDCKRDGNENDELLCERDEKFDPCGIDPG
jgi:hypothetical protein